MRGDLQLIFAFVFVYAKSKFFSLRGSFRLMLNKSHLKMDNGSNITLTNRIKSEKRKSLPAKAEYNWNEMRLQQYERRSVSECYVNRHPLP